MLAWLGITAFVKETVIDNKRKFDLLGFFLLSVTIGSLQLFLDRGESKEWFSSGEIIIEAALAGAALYLFIAHIFTSKKPFIEPGISAIKISLSDCCSVLVWAPFCWQQWR
ncbi:MULTISPECIES: hypothetical protein [unclassified Leclercia]|uniref:hypothetical protein n=1 Tax=unclassified Leclercia TaxID=2627398 RepID=UPI0020731DA8|nr:MULTISPECIES: hypothetical protein [unclassified Leclercia]MCM5695301.1 hypothetical protein [Leclercia sp. LTM01]MCM5699707.1 hypothetical protein [Leclercia sp. LTM14]